MSVICDLYSVFFLTCIIDDTNWRIPLDAAHLSFLSSTLGAKIRRAGLTSDVVIEFVVKRCQSKVSVATSRTSSRVQVTNLTVDFTISASCSCINTATNACTMLGMISFASHAFRSHVQHSRRMCSLVSTDTAKSQEECSVFAVRVDLAFLPHRSTQKGQRQRY